MAVYTDVSDEELTDFVARYDIGAVLFSKGIAEGVENTNYLVRTEAGTFILTLYERRVDRDDLPFFIALMDHLAAAGMPTPVPVKARDGKVLHTLAGRPAALVSFLDGMWRRKPDPGHCAALGRAVATMHEVGTSFSGYRENRLGAHAWRPLFETSAAEADTVRPGLRRAVEAELDAIEACWPSDLPAGIIHADLFPDNVFFIGRELSGIIDFYFACNDLLAYDLAICLNAWCFETDLSFNVTKARALLSGYGQVRPFTDAEYQALPILARGAALRFLLTRLHDWLRVPEGALVTPKNPLDYWRRLQFHQRVASPSDYGFDRRAAALGASVEPARG